MSGFAEVVVAAVKVSPKNSRVRGENRVIGSELRAASTERALTAEDAENSHRERGERCCRLLIVLYKSRCRLLPQSGSIFNACKVLQILCIT